LPTDKGDNSPGDLPILSGSKLKYMKHKLTEIKRRKGKFSIIVREFNTPSQ
jgi:hypothetical protein